MRSSSGEGGAKIGLTHHGKTLYQSHLESKEDDIEATHGVAGAHQIISCKLCSCSRGEGRATTNNSAEGRFFLGGA